MGIGGSWERCKSAVFWQTDQYLTVFSTRTEKEGNTGFPGSVLHHRKRKGAQFGLIEDEDSGNEGEWDCVSTPAFKKIVRDGKKGKVVAGAFFS
jgi:hypothetical protein